MTSIYKLMKKNWKIYCLMSGIALIEEMTKPYQNIQIKNNIKFECFSSIQLRGMNKDIINEWFYITKIWERKLKMNFIGPTFKEIKKDKDGKWYFGLLPNWLYYITKTTGKLPSSHVNKAIFYRLKNWRVSSYKSKNDKYILKPKVISKILNKKSIYNSLMKNKKLAAGAFIISFDFEFRGLTIGQPNLCMSNTYKDFLNFMLKIANEWGWATSNKLSKVNMDYSRNLGINATDQSKFSISIKELNNIYSLAGPVVDLHKDKCIKFHIKRSRDYVNKGGSKETKKKIYKTLKKLGTAKTTDLQFYSNVCLDVLNTHLNNLRMAGLVERERMGKYYLWGIKNADKRNI